MIKMEMTNREALIYNVMDEIQHMDNKCSADFLHKNPELVGLLCDYCVGYPDGEGNCLKNIERWLDNDN